MTYTELKNLKDRHSADMLRAGAHLAANKYGFFLPECAYFDYLNDAPDDAEAADQAKQIEKNLKELWGE